MSLPAASGGFSPKRIVRWLLSQLRMRQTYLHTGDAEAVVMAFFQLGAATVRPDCYELRAGSSLGTLRGLPTKGIYVTATVTKTTSAQQIIRFTTATRPEHYFIALLFGLVLVGSLLDAQPQYAATLFLLGLWPVFHGWFHIVYRSQEQTLVDEAARKLRLRKLKTP